MALTLDDAAIRAALHTDILAAWAGLTSVNDDPPFLPQTSADLPQAFVQLQDIEPDYAGRNASWGQVSVWHKYAITGQWAWPATGTIEAAKLDKVNAILPKLTKVYAGWKTHVSTVQFIETTTSAADPANQEPIYQIVVQFDLEVASSL